MLNSCNFVGNIGSVEERNISQDRKAVKYSIAVSESYKDKNNQWQKKTNWFKFTRFMSNKYENNYKKGDAVAVTCKASNNEWTDAEGNKRTSIEFICQNISLVYRKDKDGQGAATDSSAVNGSNKSVGGNIGGDDSKQDLPF